MRAFDLTPPAYRRDRELRRRCGWLLRAWLVGLVVLGIGGFTLALGVRSLEREVVALEGTELAADRQRLRIDELAAERARLERELEALELVRGGVAVRELLVAVDRALERDVWFVRWRFRRAGARVEDARAEGAVALLVVATDRAGDEAWRLRTDMNITGRAADHSALAAFVQRLVRQPEIETARVQSTRTLDYQDTQVVSFELEVSVREGRA